MSAMDDWDRNVAPHLNRIAEGAELASRHARQLTRRPEWRTHSQDELDDAWKALSTALQEIEAARAAYDSKEVAV